MKRNITRKGVLFLCCFFFTGTVLAYGSSSSTKTACKKPKFSDFVPEKMAEVAPQSGFSFMASAATKPETIAVSVKKVAVDINVDKKGSKYLVTGNLPESLKGTHARIAITAMGPKSCKGKDGWLVKITDE